MLNIFMDKYDLRNMDYWYAVTVQYGVDVADIIVISSLYHSVETPYIFKRFPALCYMEELRDSGIRHQPDRAFLEVINMLKARYPHLRVAPRKVGKDYESKNLHTR